MQNDIKFQIKTKITKRQIINVLAKEKLSNRFKYKVQYNKKILVRSFICGLVSQQV